MLSFVLWFFFFESAADELLRRKRGWGMGQVCSVDKRTDTFVYSSIFRNLTLVSLPFFFFFFNHLSLFIPEMWLIFMYVLLIGCLSLFLPFIFAPRLRLVNSSSYHSHNNWSPRFSMSTRCCSSFTPVYQAVVCNFFLFSFYYDYIIDDIFWSSYWLQFTLWAYYVLLFF